MRRLAPIVAFLVGSLPAGAVIKKPVPKKTAAAASKTPATKKVTAKKTPAKKSGVKAAGLVRPRRVYRPPVVYVAASVRRGALETVSARAMQPASALEGAGALVPFFEQVSHPQANVSLHVLQYGDSHTASDDWADMMRQAMQRRFGSGGPGFTLAGHPFPGYRRFDVKGTNSRGWYTDGLVGHPGDGLYGLGGVSLTTQAAGETVSLSTECEELELHYLQQPGGGQIQLLVDEVPVDTITTAGDVAPGIYRYTPAAGSHAYLLRTVDNAPVRLFGWVAQNHTGITYETLGINGAQIHTMLDWNQSILSGELAAREPALIIVAYGTNEALNRGWTAQDYAASFGEVLKRLRSAAPLASILVVGPPDCATRVRGQRIPFPHLDEVIEVQRQVSRAMGCAFWDWRSRMGGAGSVQQWVQAGLGQGDYVHLTGMGYRLVGSMLFDEIMAQYNRFVTLRAEAAALEQ